MTDMTEVLISSCDADVEEFLRDLTALSRRHGIGITGEAQLFLMERDDYDRSYRGDRESRIDFA